MLRKYFSWMFVIGATLTVGALAAAPAAGEPGNGHAQASGHRTDGTAATVGSPTSPQPNSNADNTGHGANTSGPYTSTRNGSPSGNGSGSGLATGEPCAGCVGKADNKNPNGQMPNASDPNAGYECDRNHGIAQTNPAHTGCATTPQVQVGGIQVVREQVVGQPVSVPGQQVAASRLTAASLGSGRAIGNLPATGADLVGALVTGVLALTLGGIMVLMGRRRSWQHG